MISPFPVNPTLPLVGAMDTPLSEALGILLVGFLFVIVVLSILAVVTATLGTFFKKQGAKAVAAKASPATPAPTATPAAASASPGEASADSDDPRLVVAIAAAVHFALQGQAHRIVSVHTIPGGWAQEGRRQIFSSHRVR